MSGTILLEVVSPQKVVIKEEVESIIVPGTMGYLGILSGHAPIMSALDIGVVTIKKDGKEDKIAISGGFLEVSQNKAVVLAETAEKACDIDMKRAESARERAEGRLNKRTEEVDILRAELALKRSIARLKAVKS